MSTMTKFGLINHFLDSLFKKKEQVTSPKVLNDLTQYIRDRSDVFEFFSGMKELWFREGTSFVDMVDYVHRYCSRDSTPEDLCILAAAYFAKNGVDPQEYDLEVAHEYDKYVVNLSPGAHYWWTYPTEEEDSNTVGWFVVGPGAWPDEDEIRMTRALMGARRLGVPHKDSQISFLHLYNPIVDYNLQSKYSFGMGLFGPSLEYMSERENFDSSIISRV